MECPICCEPTSETVPCCPSSTCHARSCRDCFQKDLTQELRSPRCMDCKAGIPIEWILESWSSEWIQNVFWKYWASWKREEERGLLPLDEEEAALLRDKRDIRRQIRELPRLGVMERNKRRYTAQEIENVRLQKKALHQQLRTRLHDPEDDPLSESPPHIHGPCPRDGCNGFIRGSEHGCRLCKCRACPDCGDVLGDQENHQCSEERKASTAAIRRETRPCPQCRAAIFRTGGCDQMWCTQCRTPFSWATGYRLNEHTETLHNPHYYEWIMSMTSNDSLSQLPTLVLGQEDGHDIPCAFVYSVFLKRYDTLHRHYHRFITLHRLSRHLEHVVLPTLVETTRVRDNKDLRIQFLLGDMDADTWCQRLIHREKRRMKLRALHHMIRTSLVLIRDILRLSILRPENPPTMEEIDRVDHLMKERSSQILGCYGGKLPFDIHFHN